MYRALSYTIPNDALNLDSLWKMLIAEAFENALFYNCSLPIPLLRHFPPPVPSCTLFRKILLFFARCFHLLLLYSAMWH